MPILCDSDVLYTAAEGRDDSGVSALDALPRTRLSRKREQIVRYEIDPRARAVIYYVAAVRNAVRNGDVNAVCRSFRRRIYRKRCRRKYIIPVTTRYVPYVPMSRSMRRTAGKVYIARAMWFRPDDSNRNHDYSQQCIFSMLKTVGAVGTPWVHTTNRGMFLIRDARWCA